MTTALDFTKPSRLRKAVPGMYRHDGDRFPGLYLNVGKTKNTWYIKRRVDGKTKSIKIGSFPAMDATFAFKQGDTKTGVAKSNIITVRDGWMFWCDTSQAQGGMSDDHRNRMTRQLEMHAKGIMDSNVADVSSADVQAVLNELMAEGKNATARAVRIGIGNAFNFADVFNPVAQKKTRVAKSEEKRAQWELVAEANDRDPDDWAVMWEAIKAKREKNIIIGTAWVVMFFTGIRSDNVRSLTWDQVDLQNKSIHLTKMKNGLARTLPVADVVIDALQQIRAGGFEFVFPGPGKDGYIGDTRELRADIGGESVRIIEPHDCRRHFMQAAAEAFLPEYVAHFLRGDKKGGKDNDMLMKYLKRMGNRRAVDEIEKVYFQRIKVTPSFDLEE